jgi:hypothetical protein
MCYINSDTAINHRILTEGFIGLLLSLQTNATTVPRLSQSRFLTNPLPTHYSPVIMTFDAICPKKRTASSKKPQNVFAKLLHEISLTESVPLFA